MSKQKVMFYTRDNQIIVADIDFSGYTESQKHEELKRLQDYFLQYKYKDICLNYNNRNSKQKEHKQILSLLDGANTSFVNKYVAAFDYTKNRSEYSNSIKSSNFPSKVKKQNTLHFDCAFDDSFVPKFIKNLGFHLAPKDILEEIDLDDPDFEKNFFKQKVRMQVFSSSRLINFYRYHYKFSPTDYVRLRRLITDYEKLSPKPDINEYCLRIGGSRERKLFGIYAHEIDYLSKNKTLFHHEFHHVKNRMVFQAMLCKSDFKRLTAENAYRLEVENERSAYLSQTIEAVNIYLQNGKLNDFSMFDNFSEALAEKIKSMSPDKRISYLTNMNNVVNFAIERFESTRREYYDENQFKNSTKSNLLIQPMDVPEDLSGDQFRLLRSAYYSVAVYNPVTKRKEIRNLSRYISPENEIKISSDERIQIIGPAKVELRKKINEFRKDSLEPGVNPAFLDEARAFMLKSIRSPRIISEVQTLNVADLVDGKPQVDENQSNPSPAPSYQPTPVFDDNGEWSDDLQKYWKGFSGYKEITKDFQEYSFSIKDQKVTYYSKDSVRLGETCKYEMFKRLVDEPSSAKKVVRFEESLSKEQALMLYVACVNSGRRMRGAIPQDLSAIDKIKSIPKDELSKFKSKISSSSKSVGSAAVVNPRPTTKSR